MGRKEPSQPHQEEKLGYPRCKRDGTDITRLLDHELLPSLEFISL